MSSTMLRKFQTDMTDALVRRFNQVRAYYEAAAKSTDGAAVRQIRQKNSAVMLQAPTGSGKTLIAAELVGEFSSLEKMVWFWFVPFTGLISQTRHVFQAQAPAITLMDVATDRFVESLRPGATYLLSWQSVAARRAETRVVRETRDEGLSIDALITSAREVGYRIGCVVDEAHHGFHRPGESTRFFSEVLQPDYTLMMTATPRDSDAMRFSQITGYEVGPPDAWPTVSREQAVDAGLLKADVKTVRFIAKRGMERQIVDFERLALSQCWELHKAIRSKLSEMEVGLTPLMLVQVPNGGQAVSEAEAHLIAMGVPAARIRKHTADEPDEQLNAIANDPDAEVLIFKMAIAMGFDAPRAFTLAALRGVRDKDFGIQVVGRIMRVHRLLQARVDVPAMLKSGYVFLANEEDQEGLRSAAELINEMAAKQPQLGSQSVITVSIGELSSVQIVNAGQNLELPLDAPISNADAEEGSIVAAAHAASEWVHARQEALPLESGNTTEAKGLSANRGVTSFPKGPESIAAVLLAASAKTKRVKRAAHAPLTLKTEVMPDVPDNIEEQIVNLIDFTPVLLDRERQMTRVTRRTEGLFEEDLPIDESILAQMSPAILAEKAKQIAFEFNDLDERDFLSLLLERFKSALINQGIPIPPEAETLRRQLDIVLVRNPRLIRDAQKRIRASLIQLRDVWLPDELEIPGNVARARKNLFGIFPPELNRDERAFAEILDTDPEVDWWHRNQERKPWTVVLYAWSGGMHGFSPDFVVAIQGRIKGDSSALAEIKGPHLQYWERAKAAARHTYYGRVFMIGRQTPGGDLMFLRLENDDLVVDGVFEVRRLKHDA
jgi:hypothetical protein